MAATLEILDLLATDLAHPRPRPRFGSPVPPPPRSERSIAPADLDAPVWPGAQTAPPARTRVDDAPWVRVEAPLHDPVPEIELDPDEEVAPEPDVDDIAPESLEPMAYDAPAVDHYGEFESAWFGEEPVFAEGPKRVGWLDLVLPISAGLGGAALFGTTLALFGSWS